MPPQLENTVPEYDSARQHAALFDLSSRSKIELAGPEALMFLHNLCTQDVKNLPVGAGCEAFLTNSKARVVAHILVGHFRYRDGNVVWLDCEPGLGQKVLDHLDHFRISEQVEFADRTQEWAMFHACGPEARTVLEKALGDRLPDLPPLHHVSRSMADIPCFIRRHEPLALPGHDVFCESKNSGEAMRLLIAAGATPTGGEVYETLRVEAGTPVFGKDIDEDRFVVEVGRTQQAISYTKGCFLGQEPIVMARDRGHVNRLLVGVKVEGQEPLETGTRLFREGAEVGQVTSSVLSPRPGQVIALAYLRRENWDPGMLLHVGAADGRQGVVVGLPIVSGV